MSVQLVENGFKDLGRHVLHDVVVVAYGSHDNPINDEAVNIALECETCGEVLLDFNNPNMLIVRNHA